MINRGIVVCMRDIYISVRATNKLDPFENVFHAVHLPPHLSSHDETCYPAKLSGAGSLARKLWRKNRQAGTGKAISAKGRIFAVDKAPT